MYGIGPGVMQPLLVDERVAGDAGAGRERQREAAAVAPDAHAAHEHDPGGDRDHAEHLPGPPTPRPKITSVPSRTSTGAEPRATG